MRNVWTGWNLNGTITVTEEESEIGHPFFHCESFPGLQMSVQLNFLKKLQDILFTIGKWSFVDYFYFLFLCLTSCFLFNFFPCHFSSLIFNLISLYRHIFSPHSSNFLLSRFWRCYNFPTSFLWFFMFFPYFVVFSHMYVGWYYFIQTFRFLYLILWP